MLSTAHRVAVTPPPPEFADRYQSVTFETVDGLELSAWYIPGSRPEGIVLIHGINYNRFGLLPEAIVLAEAGYHLIMPDLRGHGESEGYTISYGYYEAYDVQAATDFLLAQTGVERVAALGTSFGGSAVARAAAQDERLAGVIIQSSFSSLPFAVERSFTNYTGLPKWPLAPIMTTLMEFRIGIDANDIDTSRDLAKMSPRPVMIIHGTQDHLFVVDHAQQMYDAINGPKSLWIVEGMGHNSPVYEDGLEYRKRVLSFLDWVFGPDN
ncbi:MAG: alpha/beta fold hydrolase [Chloroflexota bacterium]